MIRKGWVSSLFIVKLIDKRRPFRYFRGIIEMKVRHDETELLAGPEGGLLLNLAQQMVLYLGRNSLAVCSWHWSCILES